MVLATVATLGVAGQAGGAVPAEAKVTRYTIDARSKEAFRREDALEARCKLSASVGAGIRRRQTKDSIRLAVTGTAQGNDVAFHYSFGKHAKFCGGVSARFADDDKTKLLVTFYRFTGADVRRGVIKDRRSNSAEAIINLTVYGTPM